jgi:hypothetical protein
MQDGGIDEKKLAADIHEHTAVIGRQVWSGHHGPNSANGVEAKSNEERMERACAGPACAASAEFQPGFKEVFRRGAGQRGCVCGANVDQFADVVERNPLAPRAVKAAERVAGWSGTAIETKARKNAFDELFWQRFGLGIPAGLSEMTYGHADQFNDHCGFRHGTLVVFDREISLARVLQLIQ